MELPSGKRRYTHEEKRQLIANLDIEVAHRTRQFESWLADRLENFTIHQEGQVSRIPKQVRNMTMRDFGEKYGGNIQNALRGYQKERLAAAGADATLGEIDKSMRKRKWVASQEAESEASGSTDPKDDDSLRLPKNARTQLLSPKKAGPSTGPGANGQRQRLASATNKTPIKARTMSRIPASPSPQKKTRIPTNAPTLMHIPRPPSRSTSPMKTQSSKSILPNQTRRVPSTSTFNPSLPPKTPIYPTTQKASGPAMIRLPRKDEHMLSENGSPLANPYEFGLGWFKGIEMAEMDTEAEEIDSQLDARGRALSRTLKRTKSSIVIRRDPSVAIAGGLHSRTDSQASFYTASSSHSHDSLSQYSQSSSSHPSSSQSSLGSFRFPSSRPVNDNLETPRPLPKHTRSFSALVAIPTKDGQILEFDPLQTSPGALDALEGISDSAKKQARVEMGRLVQAAVDKWKIR